MSTKSVLGLHGVLCVWCVVGWCSNWVGNCVGRHNHRTFIVWAVLQLFAEILMLFFLYQGPCCGLPAHLVPLTLQSRQGLIVRQGLCVVHGYVTHCFLVLLIVRLLCVFSFILYPPAMLPPSPRPRPRPRPRPSDCRHRIPLLFHRCLHWHHAVRAVWSVADFPPQLPLPGAGHLHAAGAVPPHIR